LSERGWHATEFAGRLGTGFGDAIRARFRVALTVGSDENVGVSDRFHRFPPVPLPHQFMDTSPNPAPSESWLELPEGKVHRLMGACAIGRQPDNDLVLDTPGLSRRHALLAAEAAGYTISDLHSRNGTFVNRTVITRPVRLQDGDEIRLGELALRFRTTVPSDAGVGSSPTQRLDQMRQHTCWLLLVDIAGFGALNQELGSEAALRQTQAWIKAISPLIERRGGRINRFLGDAIFAYWLVEKTPSADVLATLREIEAWRPTSALAFRHVVHLGQVLFTHSDLGEELTGQEVNFIFRAEKIAKTFGAPAMLSEPAMKALGLEGRATPCGQSAIAGMSGVFSFFPLPAG
jgi:class 3 adenylate cyclase